MRLFFQGVVLIVACTINWGCVHEAPLSTTSQITPVEAAKLPTDATLPQPLTIALLLPLSGSLQQAGQAVRDGFITAYHNDNSAQKPTHILTFDTNSQTISAAYANAVQAHANLIVGPLEKNNLQTLVQAGLITKPTLALNYLDVNDPAPPNLWQFGLSPLDEARQAALLAYQTGLRNAVIMTPRTSWGHALMQTYTNAWQAAGGTVVAQFYFTNNSAALDQQIRALVGNKTRKIDVILLAAAPQIARQIKPLLKFYATDELPVYATALVYGGTPQPAFDNDLNDITFCDMPWTLPNNTIAQSLRQQVALFWPTDFAQNSRLYALGIDAYHLSNLLPNLTTIQPISGATGLLTVNTAHLIVRQLSCAQFTRGVPQLVTSKSIPQVTLIEPTPLDLGDDATISDNVVESDNNDATQA